MKYTISQSLITSPAKDFRRDQVVGEKELTEAGHDVSYLLQHGAIIKVAGSEDTVDPVQGTDTVPVGNTTPAAADKAAADKAAADK